MPERFDPDQVMQSYAAAYMAANSKPAPDISYERGWFTMRSSRAGGLPQKYRRRQIERMRERLAEYARDNESK